MPHIIGPSNTIGTAPPISMPTNEMPKNIQYWSLIKAQPSLIHSTGLITPVRKSCSGVIGFPPVVGFARDLSRVFGSCNPGPHASGVESRLLDRQEFRLQAA